MSAIMAAAPLLPLLFFLVFFLYTASACDRCLHQSKASYLTSPLALTAGACGYGSMALSFSNSYQLAAGNSALYRDGVGCGACFQVRCKNSNLCSQQGVKIILTSLNKSEETGFALSSRAFTGMAKQGLAQEMKKHKVIDIEYKRIPCEYKQQNLAVRVEEESQKPHHIAIKFLFQGGQTDIVAVDVAQVGSAGWHYMTRKYGAVWETDRVPTGPLQLRLVVTGGFDGKWVWAQSVLPADWKVGMVYDTGVQINDIAQEGCSTCDEGDW